MNKILSCKEKILDDYIKFLSTPEGVDILPYAYLGAGEAYEKLIKNSKEYYLFNDEVELIKNNQSKLSDYLRDVVNILEIGPGSNHTVINKTVPILKSATTIENYYPIDICKSYLTDACEAIRTHMPKLNITPIEYDIVKSSPLKITNFLGKNALIFFGSTLGNFDNKTQSDILTKIYYLLQPGDMFFITLDTFLDKEKILRAYNNSYLFDILYGSLNYLSNICKNFESVKDAFDPCCIWNEKQSCIELFFIIKNNITLQLSNNKDIEICKSSELRGIKSQKFNKNNVIKLLEKHKFFVIDVVDNSNKMQMFICRR